MSEEKVQSAPTEEQPQIAQEMATESQDQPAQPNVGELIAESKKYRARSQKVETELSQLKTQIESDRQSQLEKQEEWQTLAEERKIKLDEQDGEISVIRAERKAEHERLLSDFSDEEREELKELTLQSLKLVHKKLITNKSIIPNVSNSRAVANNNPTIDDWTKLSSKDKRNNWRGIVDSFKNK
jgi:hypothetical protein